MKSITYSELAQIISEAEKLENTNYFHYRDLNPDDMDIHNDHCIVLSTYCRILYSIKIYMEA